jgi:DNA-binding response OmpR family regulator
LEILVVNGKPPALDGWCDALAADGHRLRFLDGAFGNGQANQRYRPELIILDTDGPKEAESGVSTIETIQRRFPGVQILVISGWNLDRMKALDHGATVVLSRPLESGVVLELTKAMLERSQNAAAERMVQ